MLSFNSLLIFSENPGKLAEFYKKVFNVDPGWKQGEYSGFQVGTGFVMVGPHDKVKGKNKNPERMMFNVETKNVEEEFKRIKATGAKVVAAPYHPGESSEMTLATFEDPDGNYFQLATPME
ncbi:MAG TPA: VOC family protein [Patescibacteria group bacterium]|nr:VOC family protein [Patescibacteria group bacterium]